MTDEELLELNHMDPPRLDELTRRAGLMRTYSYQELAHHLELATRLYCYYISETGDYLDAAVAEAAARLRSLKP